MKFFKATLHSKQNHTNPSVPKTMDILLPVDAILFLKEVDTKSYQVNIKPEYIPKIHFEVGEVTAKINANQIEFL
ncbi:hypothetical protein [Mucilaginibacter lappiensis]|uniref:Uncharacterized protein n=1 Tax=Mucilaginibacter lappiensis TaxID=354630 RepID=A0A841JD36_9SPHI|nr:hypothetical protein [Mucilaginibacter lappiensis]MBB6126385.1 hypothetical protein [Mucilaginibacter lappiensis]